MLHPTVTVQQLLSTAAGTGRTGFIPVAPNNYPFYQEEEVYTPVVQSDGGQLSGEAALIKVHELY